MYNLLIQIHSIKSHNMKRFIKFNKTLIGLILGYLGLICIVAGFLWIAFKLHWVVGVIVSGLVCLSAGLTMSDV